MPIHGYPGNVITANPTAPTVSSASGVWTTEQQLIATAAGRWPMAATQISRSLRFNSADSAYLNRTPASAGNRRTWTYSFWVKRAKFSRQMFLGVYTNGNDVAAIEIESDQIYWYDYLTSAYKYEIRTTQVLRDPSAWYHIVCVLDTTQATSSNRNKIYVNGSLVTALTTATYPTQNADGKFNTVIQHSIGTEGSNLRLFLDAYQTETYFIDGLALDPSYFGFNDSNTGVWTPKQYTGTYGTNGFYVNFSDNSNTTAATLGKDYSGNSNNWTPNNFSVTAGAGNDSLVDSPTSYGTDTGVGGEVRGNYATLNPLRNNTSNALSNGNLDVTSTTGNFRNTPATIGFSSGKWYWEVLCNTVSGTNNRASLGISTNAASTDTQVGNDANSHGYYSVNGNKYFNGSNSSYGASYSSGDVIGFALDMDAGTLVAYKNNASQGTLASGLTGTWFPAVSILADAGTTSISTNFGQRAFAYTAPSGFKALCTQNLPTPTIGATSTTQANQYFDAELWTGNDTVRTITFGMQPDFIWTKARNAAAGHRISDSVRGASGGIMLNLSSNSTAAENTDTAVTGIVSTGITLTSGNHPNNTGTTYVGWGWKANGAGSSNTAGTITSTVSANTTSGFSIVTFTAPASGQFTVGHGLGVAPAFVTVKNRVAALTSWWTYHSALGINNVDYVALDLTNAEASFSTMWGSGGMTSSTCGFTVAGSTYANHNHVAYCFAPVAGYSAFGSYTGNGSSDGPFVYLGFRPEFVFWKNASTTGDWQMKDATRSTYNVTSANLYANLSNAENSAGDVDFLSNGFKIRSAGTDVNGSGNTIIYAAFAENPFKYSLAR
jgi:hypothetical protein